MATGAEHATCHLAAPMKPGVWTSEGLALRYARVNAAHSALYEGVTVFFLAQVFGIDLSIGQQVLVVLMSMLAGVGMAGVPGGGLPLIVVVMVQVGIPAEGIGLILGVERRKDAGQPARRTGGRLNTGNLMAEKARLPRRNPGEPFLSGQFGVERDLGLEHF
jgi:hypothetical protein